MEYIYNEGNHKTLLIISLFYIYIIGVTDLTCAPYVARNGNCTNYAKCGTCSFFMDICHEILSYRTYYVSDYGILPSGDTDAIKNEIFLNGPVACSIFASPGNYLSLYYFYIYYYFHFFSFFFFIRFLHLQWGSIFRIFPSSHS